MKTFLAIAIALSLTLPAYAKQPKKGTKEVISNSQQPMADKADEARKKKRK